MASDGIYVTVRFIDGMLELATTTGAEVVDGILYPAGNGRIGVVLIDSKQHLGIEERAVPVLRDLFTRCQRSHDGFGDCQWWGCGDNMAFGWLGRNRVRWAPDTFEQATRGCDDAFREGEYRIIEPLPEKGVDGAADAT